MDGEDGKACSNGKLSLATEQMVEVEEGYCRQSSGPLSSLN